MTEFERKVVHAFRDYFKEHDIRGHAYRRKQSRYNSQVVDVLVDSPDIGYLAIECKSKKKKYGDKLYFSSDFPISEGGHQIPRTTHWANMTGRDAALGLELRRGRGKPRVGNLYKWEDVDRRYGIDECKGVSPEDLKEFKYNIVREGSEYKVIRNDSDN